ncbi:hypothetical protein MPTK1_3g01565 [Marchantia polymorpha subsp. ruderalis]
MSHCFLGCCDLNFTLLHFDYICLELKIPLPSVPDLLETCHPVMNSWHHIWAPQPIVLCSSPARIRFFQWIRPESADPFRGNARSGERRYPNPTCHAKSDLRPPDHNSGQKQRPCSSRMAWRPLEANQHDAQATGELDMDFFCEHTRSDKT